MHRTIPLTLLLVPLSCIVMSLRSLSLILLGLVRAVSSKLPKVVLTCFLIMMVNSWIVVFRLHISNWSLLLMMMKSLMLLVRFSTIVALVMISNILLLGKAMMTLTILGFLLLTLMILTLSLNITNHCPLLLPNANPRNPLVVSSIFLTYHFSTFYPLF